jgi:hypothetical protein
MGDITMNATLRGLRFSAVCLALAALGAPVAGRLAISAQAAAGTRDEDGWKQKRKEAAHRKRRIIFNNDGDDVVYECKKATPEALLECRTTPLLGTQVDSIFYCTWSSGFSYFTHRTKVGQIFTCKEDKLANNKTDQFIAQGTDPLEIMVDFAKRNDIEIFWSFRMNDTHDVSTAWYGPLLFPQLKKDHPEWLLGSRDKPTRHGRWTTVGRRSATWRFSSSGRCARTTTSTAWSSISSAT